MGEDITGNFVPSLMARRVMEMVASGELKGGRSLTINMRDCDDVPKFIERIYEAQRLTGEAAERGEGPRFGPVDEEYDRMMRERRRKDYRASA